ncbi:MAG TPA: hypothetical protein VIK81_05300 [Patescibacteria group bacterium]
MEIFENRLMSFGYLTKNGLFKILSFLILLFFLLINGYFYQNKALALHFVDEEYNFVLGRQIIEGRKLYSEAFLNHQPLAPILSVPIQKITKPNSIFLLVKHHREAMIVYGILWLIFLYFRFGLAVLVFAPIFETTKVYLMGNLFLAESLAIYPLVYIAVISFKKLKEISKLESILIGICLSVIFFLILPLWPLIFGISIFLIIQKKITRQNILYVIIGTLPLIVLFFLTSSFKEYIDQTIFYNFRYIPFDSNEPLLVRTIKSFVTPLISIFTPAETPSGKIIQLLSLILSSNLVWLLWKKKYSLVILIIILLGLANLRFIQPTHVFYRGFHLLPWFALLVLFTVLTSIDSIKTAKSFLVKTILIYLLGATVLLSLSWGREFLFVKNDMQRDWYVNYSNQFTIGEAIKIMKNEQKESGETLFVIPDEWLIYWQSGFKLPVKINTYYPWMDKIPKLKNNFETMFLASPPTFLYCDCPKDLPIRLYLVNYDQLIKNGQNSSLFVLKSKLEDLSKDQIDKLKYYGFEI